MLCRSVTFLLLCSSVTSLADDETHHLRRGLKPGGPCAVLCFADPCSLILCPAGQFCEKKVTGNNCCGTAECKEGIPCGPNTCGGAMPECCNESCGICVEPGGFCIELACEPATTPCGPNTCGEGFECCNESCGICVKPGGVCTQEFCGADDPCAPLRCANPCLTKTCPSSKPSCEVVYRGVNDCCGSAKCS